MSEGDVKEGAKEKPTPQEKSLPAKLGEHTLTAVISVAVALVLTRGCDAVGALRSDLNDQSKEIVGLSGRIDVLDGSLKSTTSTIESVSGQLVGITASIATLTEKTSTIERRIEGVDSGVQRLQQMRASRRLYVQPGKFAAATKVSDTPLSFRWELKRPVDPNQVIDVVAEPISPTLPLEISAVISEGGIACVMTILGPEESISSFPESIDAKATIRILD